jgi:hypothetical protein
MLPRPSPSESATSFGVGTKRKGNDGRMYVVTATKANVLRWTPVKSKTPADRTGYVERRVYIVDNGTINMVVELLQGNVARVLRRRQGLTYDLFDDLDMHDTSRHHEWLEKWRDFKYTRAFVGLDPSEQKTPSFLGKLFNRKSWWHGGSSVLLQIDAKRYVCVCEKIFEFRPLDDIVGFVSFMGNNAVPYPYVVGSKYTYMMRENVYLPKELLGDADPYDVYYAKRGGLKKHCRTIPGIKVLHERHEPEHEVRVRARKRIGL